MPRSIVTGAAGFVGSHIVERLLELGHDVVGVDCFTDYYDRSRKEANLAVATDHDAFTLVEADLVSADLGELLDGAEFVFHQAGQAGVRPSWGSHFAGYLRNNIDATQRLLEAAKDASITKMVFASSSSIYGEREDGPFRETDPVDRPISPYAATKRAGELTAHTFHHACGLSITCARIFTAYGPRQRPDLAIRKFAERMRERKSVPVFGDGHSLRDFTYIDDLVDGLVRALDRDLGFAILNLGNGGKISVLGVIELLEKTLKVPAQIEWLPAQTGDVRRTWSDTTAARKALGFEPKVSIDEGIARFADWLRGQP